MANLLFGKTTYTPGSSPNSELSGLAITKDDSNDLPNGPCVALTCTVGGNINVQLVGGGTAVLTSLVAGVIYNIAVSRVLSTSTTATGMLALYHSNLTV